jgi:pimeloyl-ACP methyl ester carboxylesterase/acyl carrier protein
MGLALMEPDQGLAWLGTVIQSARLFPQIGRAEIDWAVLQQRLPIATPPFLQGAIGDGKSVNAPDSASDQRAEHSSILSTLLEQDLGERTRAITTYLQQQLGQVLGMPEPAPADQSLADLGIDSLMIMELLNLCKRDLQIMLYPRELYEHPTLNSLGRYLAQEIVRSLEPLPATDAIQATPAAKTAPEASTDSWLGQSWLMPHAAYRTPARKNPRMVFLLSAPRSGSTLLRVMLAGHPQLFCPPELHLLPFETLADRQQALGNSHLDEGLQRALMELTGQTADEVKRRLDHWQQQDTSIQTVYERLQQLAGDRLVVDKSPTYGFSLPALQRAEQLFENAGYIYLTRHPYAVIDSFVRNRMYKILGLSPEDPYWLADQVWTQSNQNIRTFLSEVPAQRQHWLRYEDLVAAPELVMAALCEFLRVPYDPAVITPYAGRRMTDGIRDNSIPVDDPNFHQRQQIDASLAEAWQHIQLPQPLSLTAQTIASASAYEIAQAQVTISLAAHQPPLATMTEQPIRVRDLALCLCHWGPEDGPTVLCLHGILDHGAVWDEIAAQWAAAGYHVIAPDLRGHGRSAHVGPAGSYQLLDYLADLDTLIRDHVNTPLILVGHSMGAVLAATLASTRPDWVQQLYLIELVVPDSGQEDTVVDQLVSHLDYLVQVPQHVLFPDLATAVDRLQRLTPTLSDDRATALAQRLTESTPQGLRWRWDPRLQVRSNVSLGGAVLGRQRFAQLLTQLAPPITLIYGNQSQFNRPADRALQDQALPQAHRFCIEGGHNLPLESPEMIAHLIAQRMEKADG